MTLQQLQKKKRELESSIGVLSVVGEDTTALEAELAEVEQQIKSLQQ